MGRFNLEMRIFTVLTCQPTLKIKILPQWDFWGRFFVDQLPKTVYYLCVFADATIEQHRSPVTCHVGRDRQRKDDKVALVEPERGSPCIIYRGN